VEVMLGRGFSAEEILEMTDLSLQEVKDIADFLRQR